jgi:formiminoglutamase
MLELPNHNIWTGRLDEEDGELGKRWHQVVELKNFHSIEVDTNPCLAIVGFCSDEGVRRNKGRVGAKNAPDIIRKAIANLPYHQNYKKKIQDFGNILLEEGNLEAARKLQSEMVSELIRHQKLPIILGGGHETALGDYLGLAEHYEKIGIINIDAHFDLRIPVEGSTSGTPFFEMANFCHENNRSFNYFCIGIQPLGNTSALFERAKDLNVQTILADDVQKDLAQSLLELKAFTEEFDAIYLSLDLDVLDGSFAPGVSAPCANGLTPIQVKSIIQTVIQTNKIKVFDVVELNPEYDQDNRTAKLAAHFIGEFVA